MPRRCREMLSVVYGAFACGRLLPLCACVYWVSVCVCMPIYPLFQLRVIEFLRIFFLLTESLNFHPAFAFLPLQKHALFFARVSSFPKRNWILPEKGRSARFVTHARDTVRRNRWHVLMEFAYRVLPTGYHTARQIQDLTCLSYLGYHMHNVAQGIA